MKSLFNQRVIIVALVAVCVITGCSRGITTYEAANGKAKCKTYVR